MVFENKRFRQFTYAYILLSVLFLVFLWFFADYMEKRNDLGYQKFILQRLIDLQAVDAEHPEDTEDTADTEDAEDAEDTGQNVCIENGQLMIKNNIYLYDSNVNQEFVRNRWMLLSVVFVFLLLLYLVCYGMVKKTFGRISQLSDEMVQVLETGEVPTDELYEEGVISQLDNSYHKLVQALKLSKENELKEKEFLRDVLQDISHQLKTPIASMVVFNDLLLERRITDQAEQQKILCENQKQIQRMEWLVLSMLKMAKLEAKSIQFEMMDKRLLPTIELAVSGIWPKAEERNHQIQIKCDPDIHFLHDSDWLAEALTNILNNAVDHMEEGGIIEIRVEDSEVCTCMFIKDHGQGIPEDELPHIFERFHRGKHNNNPNSVGIGLSLTKAIVQGQKGSITVRSELGKYTEFQITFMKK